MQISRYFWSVKTNVQLFDFRVIWIHKFNKTPGLLSFYRYSYLFMICKSSPFFWLHSVTHFVLLFRGNFKLTKQRIWKYKKSKENTKTQGKSFCSSAFRHTLGALFRKNTVSLNFQLNFVTYNWSSREICW